MEFLLADVTWENLLLIGSALGIFEGSKYMRAKIAKPRSNGTYNKALCDERHKVIEENRQEMKDSFQTVYTKIDKVMEHLLKQ